MSREQWFMEAHRWVIQLRQLENERERLLSSYAMSVFRRRAEEERLEIKRGKVRMLRMLHAEVTELTERRNLFVSSSSDRDDLLPPFVICSLWVKLPSIFISSIYLERLWCLYGTWVQNLGPQSMAIVHVGHVLDFHRTLENDSLLINIRSDGSFSTLSSRGRFSSSVSQPVYVSILGNLLVKLGTVVSNVQTIRGQCCQYLALRAPFYIGWWIDPSNLLLYFRMV